MDAALVQPQEKFEPVLLNWEWKEGGGGELKGSWCLAAPLTWGFDVGTSPPPVKERIEFHLALVISEDTTWG